jgi:hypothetical protein
MDARPLLLPAAALSLLAGLVHVANVQEHLAEWWGYGVFFVVASLAQLYFAFALRALRDAPPGPQGVAQAASATLGFSTRTFLRLGIVGNAAIIALYAVTRTVGTPIGPNAGEVEALTPISLASVAFEAALIAVLAVMLWARAHDARKGARAAHG